MRIYVTKYALTQGILEKEAREEDPQFRGMVTVPAPPGSCCCPDNFHGEGREWHRTRESARAKAEKMRLERIASLKKQIKKLEALAF